MGLKDEHAPRLAALGIEGSRQAALAEYLDLVRVWNERTNLTGASTPEGRVDVLVADPALAAPLVRPGTLIDVGSGNGSPGLVLALLRPDLKVTLLEPRARRWAFLREAVRQLCREDVSVERSRGEDYRGPSAETVTMRAVGWSPAQASALLKRGGDLLIFGGQPEASGEMTYLGSHPLQHQQVHVFRRVQRSDVSRET